MSSRLIHTLINLQQPDLVLPYWHPNLTLALVSDFPTLPLQKMQPMVIPRRCDILHHLHLSLEYCPV